MNNTKSQTPNNIPVEIYNYASILNWSDFPFQMVNIPTIGDGSCLLHAILLAYYIPYLTGRIDRRKFVRDLRHILAQHLNKPMDINNKRSKSWYETLSRGTLPDRAAGKDKHLPKEMQERSKLPFMQRELDSSAYLDDTYDEYISKFLHKNIFFLQRDQQKVAIFENTDIRYNPAWGCVVILIEPLHYSLVGVRTINGICTHFAWQDAFIKHIRHKIYSQLANSENASSPGIQILR